MPALPVVPQVLRVAMSGGIPPSTGWLSRFYVKFSGAAPTIAQANAFAATASFAFSAHLGPLLSSAENIHHTEVIDLTSSTGAVGEDRTVYSGTRTGTAMAAQVSFVESYTINRRYRGGHPRGYWRLGVESDTDDAIEWNAAFLTAVNTAFPAFFGDILASPWAGGGTLSHVNVSYYQGFTVVTSPTTGRARNVPTLRPTPLVDPVAGLIARASLGTQRRRAQFVA